MAWDSTYRGGDNAPIIPTNESNDPRPHIHPHHDNNHRDTHQTPAGREDLWASVDIRRKIRSVGHGYGVLKLE